MTESRLAQIPDLGSRFEWLCHLGEGGYGRVELAFDRERKARVALKLLPRALQGGALLKHEFRILRDIASPNLVSMLELIIEPKLECLVLEYIDGVDLLTHLGGRDNGAETLATGVSRRAEPAREAAVSADLLPETFLQLLDALAFLDRAGLVHGDLKPANIFVENRSQRVVVLDFGIARLASAAYGARAIGTPLYMAPEQFAGEPLTGATDRYALGVLLYRVLSGSFPFVGSATQLAQAKRQAPLPLGDGPLERIAVELLRPDPLDRPSIATVRAAFGTRGASREGADLGRERPRAPLVGRTEELARLGRLMDEQPPSVALLVGGAGMGKTAILDELERRLAGRALRARCYANESLRWNAIDGLVDSLVSEGFRDDRPESALAMVFPSVRSLPTAPERPEVTPVELVRLAVKELGGVLVARNRVVVVDDVQWADTDAVSFLVELMRVEPELRVVLSSRGPDTTSEILTIAIELAPRQVSTIAVEPLSAEHTAELATRIAGSDAIAPELLLQATAGVPFLVEQLCLRSRGLATPPSTLPEAEALLLLRDGELDACSRGVLALLAVNGAPLTMAVVSDVLGEGVHSAVRALLIGRVCRLENDSETRHGRVDVYHDQIRQRLLQRMSLEERRSAHASLAEATLRLSGDQSDEIARHLFAADDPRAYGFARRAAADARMVYAFERAISWLVAALADPAIPPEEARALKLELADCMRLGERHAEAAGILDTLASEGDGDAALDLLLKSAEQWLTAGELVRGITVMRRAARETELAKLDLQAGVASLLRERASLALRGLASRPARALDERSAAAAKLHVDVAWTLGGCLALIDPLRAALVHSVGMVRALELGEPERVMRALIGEAVIYGMFGTRTRRRTFALLDRVEQLADALDGHARGLALASRSVAEIQAGNFAEGFRSSAEGLSLLARHPKTVGWELMTTRHFHLHALYYLGRFRELEEYIEEEYRASSARGNRHRTSDVSLGHGALSCLLTHGREAAMRRVEEAGRFWADVGTNLQSYYSCVGRSLIALWDGDGLGAWRAYVDGPRGSFPLQILVPEGLRVDALHNLGRAAVASAISSRSARRTAIALALTAALAIEPQPHALPLARLQLAGLAAALGAGELTTRLAARAARDLRDQGLAGYAAVAAGLCERRFDSAPLAELGVSAPRQLAAVLTPGALMR